MPLKQHTRTILVPEKYPDNYVGLQFITLIQIDHTTDIIAIVDNATPHAVSLYAIDQCSAENIDKETIIDTAISWYENNPHAPFSVELSIRNLSRYAAPILRIYNPASITRAIGPLPFYSHNMATTTKKRRIVRPTTL